MQNALLKIKVLDLTMNLPGPFMTWLMAEMGAQILKVEQPGTGDFARNFNDPGRETYFPIFDTVNRGKKSITLDLKQNADRESLLELMKGYNIVVEGFRPGVLRKLGIDYATVSKIYPDVIYVSISGYGQEGSYAKKGGHDLNYQALAGCFDSGCMEDATAFVPPVAMADIGGGSLFALTGLLAAIIERTTTGLGQHLDVSMVDGAFAFNVLSFCQMKKSRIQEKNEGHFLSGNQPFYYIYETRDNRHMSLGAVEPKFWIAFCEAVSRNDLIPLQFGGQEVISQVSKIFKTRTRSEWADLFNTIDACCEPVLSIKEVMQSDLCRERNFIKTDDHGDIVLNCPIKSMGEPLKKPGRTPDLGEYNDEVKRCPKNKKRSDPG
ncbi:Crotonobetainyl-CoA:carnitine CoA-transferase CaiB [Desulfocicer vacuolatum DSM 3385]|uniref:Crotonobetainyl-CoA:carnitine CoA-transferase CaiB n=1 Tax=Desulfocicer vacuolatum DSM 3385 TaxID=1121400 RepID=A0A1W2CWQ0_9BACT|nr:CaiB/BaiF CoA-transferase family protein [Desulfocicer vacuolatum]SMC89657.1 Crotonobetainyl-CoA:carnitine CoA-transferase CaiB [Desulfocicer vacuolatum DSM 3385]